VAAAAQLRGTIHQRHATSHNIRPDFASLSVTAEAVSLTGMDGKEWLVMVWTHPQPAGDAGPAEPPGLGSQVPEAQWGGEGGRVNDSGRRAIAVKAVRLTHTSPGSWARESHSLTKAQRVRKERDASRGDSFRT